MSKIDYTPKKTKTTFLGLSHKYSTGLKMVERNMGESIGYTPRETTKYPSRVTPGGETNLKPTPVYTGDKMIGVSIIHKSCLQPVFSKEEATDAAHMRR